MNNKLKILKNTLASEADWNAIYNACDYATFFHSTEFAGLVKAYLPQINIAGRLIEFSDHKKAVFILFQGTAFKGLLKSYSSSVFGVYGGWISGDSLSEEHNDLLIKYLSTLNIFIRFSPYQNLNFENKIPVVLENTQRLNLTDSYENIHKGYEYRHRHAIKRAIEKGVTIKKAETLAEWKEYYNVYTDSIRRWGEKTRSIYKWQLFESFFNSKSGNISLYLALFEEKIVAGAICFSDKRKIIYWHGSYLEEFKNVNPATYLVGDIIRRSVGKYDYFDFMPSANLEGVLFFKNGYRPDHVAAPIFTNYNWNYKVFNKALAIASNFYHEAIHKIK